MKRNCSMAPRQALLVYAMLSAATIGIALVFTLRGAWMVLAFALVETGAVGVALLYYARHALDQERIRLAGDCLTIELLDGARVTAVRLDPRFTRVTPPAPGLRTLVALEARAVRVDVGRFLTPAARHVLAHELQRALRQVSLLA